MAKEFFPGEDAPGNDPDQPNLVAALHRASLPYSFAKRHGVLIDQNNEAGPLLVHRPGVTNMALLEARRAAGLPVALHGVDEDEFDLSDGIAG